jgi:hypothetical protein
MQRSSFSLCHTHGGLGGIVLAQSRCHLGGPFGSTEVGKWCVSPARNKSCTEVAMAASRYSTQKMRNGFNVSTP